MKIKTKIKNITPATMIEEWKEKKVKFYCENMDCMHTQWVKWDDISTMCADIEHYADCKECGYPSTVVSDVFDMIHFYEQSKRYRELSREHHELHYAKKEKIED